MDEGNPYLFDKREFLADIGKRKERILSRLELIMLQGAAAG